MKKILVALLMVVLGLPAMANVTITGTDASNEQLLISFSTTDISEVRGVALTLTVTGAEVTSAASVLGSSFNTFIDYAFTTGAGYTVGAGHPLALATLPGVATFPIASGTAFAVSVGYLDQASGQAGLTSGTVISLQLNIPDGTTASVAIAANTTRGGAVVGDDLGVVSIATPTVSVVGDAAGFTLTTSSDAHCTVTVPGEGAYPLLTGPQTITAVADAGWHFVAWTGDVANVANVNAASTTINMIADAAIVATSAQDPETISTPTVTKTTAAPAIAGRINSGRTETFLASGAVSSYADTLEYQFNWGDGSALVWGAASQTHVFTYTAAVTRNVTVQARCIAHPTVLSAVSAAAVQTSEAVKSTAGTSGATYAAWATFGRPNCWAFQRNCDGDANGTGTGLGNNKVWVKSDDLAVLSAAYNKIQTALLLVNVGGVPGICAENNRTGTGLGNNKVWVKADDLTQFALYYNKIQTSVPVCALGTNYWYYTN